jgi:hypothetical protein
MSAVKLCSGILIVVLCSVTAYSQTVNEYIQQAEERVGTGDLDGAVSVMQEATEAYPDDPTAHAFLGGYLSQSAGASDDMMVKASRAGQAFDHLDKAPSEDMKSEALYALGLAYRRKGLSVWEELITSYPKSESVQRVYER